jgi:hypothetical protein
MQKSFLFLRSQGDDVDTLLTTGASPVSRRGAERSYTNSLFSSRTADAGYMRRQGPEAIPTTHPPPQAFEGDPFPQHRRSRGATYECSLPVIHTERLWREFGGWRLLITHHSQAAPASGCVEKER